MENPAATKAQIVKALKAMQLSLAHGERVRLLLKLNCFKSWSPQVLLKCSLSKFKDSMVINTVFKINLKNSSNNFSSRI